MKKKVLIFMFIFMILLTTIASGRNFITSVFKNFGATVEQDEKTQTVLDTDNVIDNNISDNVTDNILDNESESVSDNVTKDVTDISTNNDSFSKDLKIHFIDVGQADSILVELPNEEEILVDAGNNGDESTIINYISSLGINDIEYLVLTHPHEDHIGGAAEVIDKFEISTVYMPDRSSDTKTYLDTINAINANNINIVKAEGGLEIIDQIDLKFEVLAPNSMFYSELNEYSLVTKLTYENTSFIFTGDAESVSELEMIRAGYSLDVDLLKVGHHGGRTSTSKDFLSSVTPEYAIISSGIGNEYGHPHQETLNRLNNIGAKVYRTDEQGTIIATSDGNEISIDKAQSSYAPVIVPIAPVINTTVDNDTELAADSTANYVGNKNSLKFHYNYCSSVSDMKESNKVFIFERNDAINQGYVPCKICNP